jgi:hypothetical protein
MNFNTLDLYLGYIVSELLNESDKESDLDDKNLNDKVSSALNKLKSNNKDLNLDVKYYLNFINKIPDNLLFGLLFKLKKRYEGFGIKSIILNDNLTDLMYLLNDILYYTTYMLILYYHNSVSKEKTDKTDIETYNETINYYLENISFIVKNQRESNLILTEGEYDLLNISFYKNEIPELPNKLLTEFLLLPQESLKGGNAKVKKMAKKEILGRERCIYKKPGDRKEYLKHKGELITVKDYKKRMKDKK